MTAGASTLPARRFSGAVERRVDVSVLVPAKDEAENLPLFMQLAAEAFAADPAVSYEVVVIDDGSVDDSWRVLQELEQRYEFLRSVRHRSRRGIADALRTGYLNASEKQCHKLSEWCGVPAVKIAEDLVAIAKKRNEALVAALKAEAAAARRSSKRTA